MLLGDLTHVVRALRKSPVFTVTAVLTIALGIGASTAIFSVTNAVLPRPLPYKNPDRLVLVWEDMRRRNVRDSTFSSADFFDLRNGTTAFEGLAAVVTGRGPLPAADGTLEQVHTGGVTTNFFKLMGARMALGRDFVEADGRPQPPAQPTGQAGAQNATPPARLPTVAILSSRGERPGAQCDQRSSRCRHLA
jgi:MacB-like periplasmic core domain